jgi:hypothetical protein
LKEDCCDKCNFLIRGRYLLEGLHGAEILLIKYRESSSFPFALREFQFCPHCGKTVEQHRANKDNKNFCDPFAASTNPELGQYVCKLESMKEEQFLFDLLSHDETVAEGSLDYPSPASIKHCPYCGEILLDDSYRKAIAFRGFI